MNFIAQIRGTHDWGGKMVGVGTLSNEAATTQSARMDEKRRGDEPFRKKLKQQERWG